MTPTETVTAETTGATMPVCRRLLRVLAADRLSSRLIGADPANGLLVILDELGVTDESLLRWLEADTE